MRHRSIQFYFDYVSPNAYIAWTQISRLVEKYEIKLEPIPVLFSGLLDAHNQRGPAEVPAKMRWMVENLLWKASQLEIPLNSPVSHPFNPLLALRISSLSIPADKRRALITAIFDAAWVRHVAVSDPAALAEILNEHGWDAQGLIKEAESSRIKELLRKRTELAARSGIFGVPTMLVDRRLFWGFDDFPHLEAYLDGQASLPEDDIDAWSKVSPSAYRKGRH